MNEQYKQTAALRVLIGIAAMFSLSMSTFAQRAPETCPVVVETALAQTGSLCGTAGRNEICYGFDMVRAEPSSVLTAPGDVSPVSRIQSLALMGLDAAIGQWGMALARLQVNLPDTLPGENVTFLMYGDTTFEPLPDGTTANAPVTAFRLRTGISGITCGATEMSGLLVQTPDGGGTHKAAFTLNGVDIRLGSTIALTASTQNGLRVRVVEGAAVVQAEGRRSVALAGSEITVPLDDELQASGPPELPVPYDRDELENLPVTALDRQITIADPLDEETLAELIRLVGSGEDLDDWLDSDAYRRLLPPDEHDDQNDHDQNTQSDESARAPRLVATVTPLPPPAGNNDDSGGDDDGGDDGGDDN